MASSNPKNIDDTKSFVPDNNSKLKDPSLAADKPSTEPKNEEGEPSQNTKELKTKVVDALRFLASIFEEGGPSENNKDELDESIFIDWLKLNVGDGEECQQVFNVVKSKVLKAEAMINEIRTMGHELTDDYVVDLNFFSDED